MKRLLASLTIFIFFSCSKEIEPKQENVLPEKCFEVLPNYEKRSTGITPMDEMKIAPGAINVLYLDFDGDSVKNTPWNWLGDMYMEGSGLTAIQQQQILDSVRKDFAQFNVIVTTNKSFFDMAENGRKQQVLITQTWEWYGAVGGVSYVNSFTWDSPAPCFVFSSLFNYNQKKIMESISHELGHTLSLRHQSTYDINGTKINEYNSGNALEAPIMGVSFYAQRGIWWKGLDQYGGIQDDVQMIKTTLSNK